MELAITLLVFVYLIFRDMLEATAVKMMRTGLTAEQTIEILKEIPEKVVEQAIINAVLNGEGK